jgi:positive regulator of sigma E activity
MEILSSIFGLSLLAISWIFARRFIKQLREDSHRQQQLADQQRRRSHPRRQAR